MKIDEIEIMTEPEVGEYADEIEEAQNQELEDMELNDTSYSGWPVNL